MSKRKAESLAVEFLTTPDHPEIEVVQLGDPVTTQEAQQAVFPGRVHRRPIIDLTEREAQTGQVIVNTPATYGA